MLDLDRHPREYLQLKQILIAIAILNLLRRGVKQIQHLQARKVTLNKIQVINRDFIQFEPQNRFIIHNVALFEYKDCLASWYENISFIFPDLPL